MEQTPISAADFAARRAGLRRTCLAERESMPPAEHARRSALIAQHLQAWFALQSVQTLAFCWPYRAEFDARGLAVGLHQKGWQLCLPVVTSPEQPMHFREWMPDSAMVTDRYGIACPASGQTVTPDVVLLPFNAIDQAGYRLGYGAGYFDRTLAAMQPRPFVMGVGFAFAQVETIWPQPHDIPVHAFVTDAGISSTFQR